MKNKTILITGGAKRIGKSIAMHYSKLGYNIVFTYNNSVDEAQDLLVELNKNNTTNKAYKVDVRNSNEVDLFLKNLTIDFVNKMPSLIINNASIFTKSLATNFSEQDFDENIAIHLKAPIKISSFFYNYCKQNNLKGLVVNIVDANFNRSSTQYFNYLLSKQSLYNASKFMAVQFAPNVRVNCIMPGYIMGAENEDKQYLASLECKIPMKTKGEPNDIIQAIEYFNNAQYVTGQYISIDGGLSLANI